MSASGKSGKGGFQGNQGGSQLGGGGSKGRAPSIMAEPRPYNAANDFYGPGPTEPGGRLIVRQPQPGYYDRYPAQVNNYAPPPRQPMPEPVMQEPPVQVPPPFRPGNPGGWPPYNPGDWPGNGGPLDYSDVYGQGRYQPSSGISRPTNPDDLWTGQRARSRAPILERIMQQEPNRTPEINIRSGYQPIPTPILERVMQKNPKMPMRTMRPNRTQQINVRSGYQPYRPRGMYS